MNKDTPKAAGWNAGNAAPGDFSEEIADLKALDAVSDDLLHAAKTALDRMCKTGCPGVDELDEAITDFQHARSEAPKSLDDPRLQQLFGDAIEGALAFGFQGNNAPPEGHWLARFWNIGRAEAAQQAAKSAHGCQGPECRDGILHKSDCAVHNGDALPVGPCDCGAANSAAPAAVYLVATGETVDGAETYTRHEGTPPPLCDFERLYTAPMPATQAPAAVAWVVECKIGDKWVPQWPARFAESDALLDLQTFKTPFKRVTPLVAPMPAGAAVGEPFTEVFAELARATTKFPTWPTDPLHALAVLGEEFGELTKDMLQMVYEPHKTTRENVRTEALQTAAMALRLFASLDAYEYKPGEQHKQVATGGASTPTGGAQS